MSLPDSVYYYVLLMKLPYPEILNLCRTNKTIYNYCHDTTLWKSKSHQDFNYYASFLDTLASKYSWFDIYRMTSLAYEIPLYYQNKKEYFLIYEPDLAQNRVNPIDFIRAQSKYYLSGYPKNTILLLFNSRDELLSIFNHEFWHEVKKKGLEEVEYGLIHVMKDVEIYFQLKYLSSKPFSNYLYQQILDEIE